jgi:uroporphyrinogen decarboxylase
MSDRLIDYVVDRDRRLVFAWMSTIGVRLSGYRVPEIYASPEKQLEVARLMDETFAIDFAYPFDDGHIFRDALGVPMLCPDYDFPSTLQPIIKKGSDVERLRVPDPKVDGRMPLCMQGLDLISDAISKPLAVSMEGPFTLASELVGITEFMRALIRDPGFVREVLDFTTKAVHDFAAEIVKHGARFVVVCEPTASNLSPAHFERWVVPGFRAVYEALPSVWKVLHICGDTNHLLGPILEAGADGLNLESQIDFPALARKIPQDVVLVGNIDTFLIAESTPAIIEDTTRALLRAMRDFPNFLMSTACEIVPSTNLENIHAFLRAGRTSASEM